MTDVSPNASFGLNSINSSNGSNSLSQTILADKRLTPQATQPSVEDTLKLLSKGDLKAVPLPIAPAQPADKYPRLNAVTKEPELDKQGNKKARFNGKNPSLLDALGIPVEVKHYKFNLGDYPSPDLIKKWFKDKRVDIGLKFSTLNNIYAIDIDVQHFDSQNDCDSFFLAFLDAYPQVGVWNERTRSRGYRIFVRLKNQPKFKLFTHQLASGKHIGELLGVREDKCDFVVLAPSKDYQAISRPARLEDIPEFESIEELGLIKSNLEKKVLPNPSKIDNKTPVGDSHFDNLPITEVTFEKLISQNNLTTYNGIFSENDDKSKLFTSLVRDVYGFDNWIQKNYPELLTENPRDFIEIGGTNLGYDSDKIQRILNTINTSECLPAIHYVGGDEACRKKISGLTSTRTLFQVLTTVDQTILMDTFGYGKGDWKVLFGGFYRYTQKGFWELVDDSEIERLICEDLMKCYSYKKTKEGFIPEFKYATDRNKVSCLKFCRSFLWIKQPENNLRCFKNITVNCTSGEILEHSKEHYLTSLVPHDFVENADCPQVFLDFIESSYGLELLDLIRALLSMFLDPNAPYGHFPHFIGESRSGKGTLLRLIEKLYDETCVTTPISLDVFSSEEKIHQYLSGKALCLFKDLQGYQTKLGGFYEVIDNGSVQARPLFSPKSYKVTLNIRVAIASVEQLNLENAALGLTTRIIPIPTKPVRGRAANHNLEKDLEAELAGIISWALSMDKQHRNDLIDNSSQIKAVDKMKKEQEIASNPVMGFADCSIIHSPGLKVSIHDLYGGYKAYCNISGFKPLSINTFSQRLRQQFPDNYVIAHPEKINGEAKWIPTYLNNAALSHAFEITLEYGEYSCKSNLLIPGCLDLFKYEREKPKIEQTTEQPLEPIQEPLEPIEQAVIDAAFSQLRENGKDPVSAGRIISSFDENVKKGVYNKMTSPKMREDWDVAIRAFEKFNSLTNDEILNSDNSVKVLSAEDEAALEDF